MMLSDFKVIVIDNAPDNAAIVGYPGTDNYVFLTWETPEEADDDKR